MKVVAIGRVIADVRELCETEQEFRHELRNAHGLPRQGSVAQVLAGLRGLCGTSEDFGEALRWAYYYYNKRMEDKYWSNSTKITMDPGDYKRSFLNNPND